MNTATDMIMAQKIENKFELFMRGVCDSKPNIKDLSRLLADYAMVYGDVSFDEFMSKLTANTNTPAPQPEPKEITNPIERAKVIQNNIVKYLCAHKASTFKDLRCNCNLVNVGEQTFRTHLNTVVEYGVVVHLGRGVYGIKTEDETKIE